MKTKDPIFRRLTRLTRCLACQGVGADKWVIRHEESCEARLSVEEVPAGWYFWDETWAYSHGPFKSRREASMALRRYAESL